MFFEIAVFACYNILPGTSQAYLNNENYKSLRIQISVSYYLHDLAQCTYTILS